MKYKFNLHTHTKRCGHAQGEDEEYVLKAIEAGIETLGFSDHAFFEGISHPGLRGDYSELDDYIQSVLNLKEKYHQKIDIKLGFECEYMDYRKDYYRYLLEEKKFDYLIIGQHLKYDQNGKIIFYCGNDDIEGFERYKNDIIEGMKSGYFLYVAHPDLQMERFSKNTADVERICREICEASVKYDVPLEINVNGFFRYFEKFQDYPNEFFWKIAKEVGCKVLIGIDAHNPDQLVSEERKNRCLKFIEDLQINVIENIDELLKK